MRVVWITHNYPRHSGDVAGAFLHPLAMALRARGVDVRVIAPSDQGQGGHAELDGVPIHRVRYGTPAEETLAYRGTFAEQVRSLDGYVVFRRLLRAMQDAAYTECIGAPSPVVHAHWWIPGALAAPRKVRMVLTCHGTDVRVLEKSWPARILARKPFKRAKVVTTVSHSLADTIERRMHRIIPDDCIQPMPVVDVPRPWTSGGGGIVVLGRLTAQKRVELALDAFAIMRNQGDRIHLTIAGDGPSRPALEQRATALGIGGAVTFLGQIAPERVPDILKTADCCMMTARGEGLGLAAVEALMQGVPVVACEDGGGVLDVVSAEGAGRVVAPVAEAIAAAAAELVHDPAARIAARGIGELWRKELTADAVADRCLEWYGRALNA